MFNIRNSEYFDIFNEYLRYKFNDKTIEVIEQDVSNSSNTILVFYKGVKHSSWIEINFNDLWLTMRTVKIKKIKSIIKNHKI